MELLAILIAMILLQVWGSGAPLQFDGWFTEYRARVAAVLSGGPREFCVVLLPAAVVGVLSYLLHGVAYGMPELLLYIGVLLYSLGRGNIAEDIAEYLHRWQRGDFQAAFQQLQSEPGFAGIQTPPTDAASLHRCMRRHYYYRCYEGLFAVLFWFTVLGPAAALAYRLAALERSASLAQQQDSSSGSLHLLHWLDWLPARLSGIGYALIGNFDACVDAWRQRVTASRADAAELIEACGDAALGLRGLAAEAAGEALIQAGVREIEAIEALQRRALVLWLVVIAVLMIRF